MLIGPGTDALTFTVNGKELFMTDPQDSSPRLRVSDCPALSMCEKTGITNQYCRKASPVHHDHGNCLLDQMLHGKKADPRNPGGQKYR